MNSRSDLRPFAPPRPTGCRKCALAATNRGAKRPFRAGQASRPTASLPMLVCLTLLAILTAATLHAGADQVTGWVEFIDAEGNVRNAPATTGNVLFVPPAGARARVLEEKGKWRKIRLDDGREGWTNLINLRAIAATADPGKKSLASEPWAEFIDGEGNVRSGPGTTFGVLFVPPRGTRAPVLEKKDKWWKLRFVDGREGWSNLTNLKAVPAPTSPLVEDAAGVVDDPTADGSDGGPKMRLAVDLTGDGKPETIMLTRYKMRNNDPDDADYHLVVRGPDLKGPASGHILWQDTKPEFSFYIGHAGVEDLQIAGDLDDHASVELVSSRAQSDVRPPLFRLWRWEKNRFAELEGGFLYGDAGEPTAFTWSQGEFDSFDGITWVSRFLDFRGKNEIRAAITAQRGAESLFGEALLKVVPDGFAIVKWLEPLKAWSEED
jgi:SH3-like domain-containing protein